MKNIKMPDTFASEYGLPPTVLAKSVANAMQTGSLLQTRKLSECPSIPLEGLIITESPLIQDGCLMVVPSYIPCISHLSITLRPMPGQLMTQALLCAHLETEVLSTLISDSYIIKAHSDGHASMVDGSGSGSDLICKHKWQDEYVTIEQIDCYFGIRCTKCNVFIHHDELSDFWIQQHGGE